MNFYFLFLESLGTPELILILLIALIVFGPRKLPQMGRTIGKYTADFKRASQDFRQTWEREIEVEQFSDLTATQLNTASAAENTIGRTSSRTVQFNDHGIVAETASEPVAAVAAPSIREVSEAEFNNTGSAAASIQEPEQPAETAAIRKRDWL